MKQPEGTRNTHAGREASPRPSEAVNRIQDIRSKLGKLTQNPGPPSAPSAAKEQEDRQTRREREFAEANEAPDAIRERGVIVASAMLAMAYKDDPRFKTMRGNIGQLVGAREAVIARITVPGAEIGLTEPVPARMANDEVLKRATVYTEDTAPFVNACIAREQRIAKAAKEMGRKSANWLYDWNKADSDLRVAVPLSAMLTVPPRVQDTKKGTTNWQQQADRDAQGADTELYTKKFLRNN